MTFALLHPRSYMRTQCLLAPRGRAPQPCGLVRRLSAHWHAGARQAVARASGGQPRVGRDRPADGGTARDGHRGTDIFRRQDGAHGDVGVGLFEPRVCSAWGRWGQMRCGQSERVTRCGPAHSSAPYMLPSNDSSALISMSRTYSMHTDSRTNTCTHKHVHARTYVRTHACTHARTHKHARAHTRTPARPRRRLASSMNRCQPC